MDFFAPQISKDANRSVPERPGKEDQGSGDLFAEAMKETVQSQDEISDRSASRNDPERPKPRSAEPKTRVVETRRESEAQSANNVEDREAEAAAMAAGLQQTDVMLPKPLVASGDTTPSGPSDAAEQTGTGLNPVDAQVTQAIADTQALERLQATRQPSAQIASEGTKTELSDLTLDLANTTATKPSSHLSAALNLLQEQSKAKSDTANAAAANLQASAADTKQGSSEGVAASTSAPSSSNGQGLNHLSESSHQVIGEAAQPAKFSDLQASTPTESASEPTIAASSLANSKGAQGGQAGTSSDGRNDQSAEANPAVSTTDSGTAGVSQEQTVGATAETDSKGGVVNPGAGDRIGGIEGAAAASKTIATAKASASDEIASRQIEADRIFDQVKVRLAPKRPEITVRLDPPELGRLHLKLTMQGGEIKAMVTTENARVTRMFENDVSRLVRTLDEAGIRVGAIEIRTEQPATDSESAWSEGWKSSQEQSPSERREERGPRAEASLPPAPETKTAPKPIRRTASSLDLVV